MIKYKNRYDARVWGAWLTLTAVAIFWTRNPLYTFIILLSILLVDQRHGRNRNQIAAPTRFLRLALVVLLFSTLFNMLSVRFGDTVLFRLPVSIPLIGGIYTLEAAVFGFANGLVLVTLLFLFITFNRIVSVEELIHLAPKALHDLGVVLLIAVTYVPQTLRHFHQVREAQAVRGYQPRRLRDWQPLLLPLLIGGLERAMNLAEAMVARGYGSSQSRGIDLWVQLGLAVGLMAALGGWVAALWIGWPGWLLLGSGCLLIGALFWRQGREIPRTRYRPQPWTLADGWLLLAALSPVLLLLIQTGSLGYSPYPRLSWPPFVPLVGLALMLVAAPALLPSNKNGQD